MSFRRRFVQWVLVTVMVAVAFGAGAPVAHASPVGEVVFDPNDNQFTVCDTIVGNQPDERLVLSFRGPKVYGASDFFANHPGVKQPVRVTVVVSYYDAAGARKLLTSLLNVSGRVEYTTSPLVLGPLEFGLGIGPRYRISYKVEWLDIDQTTVLATRERFQPATYSLRVNGATAGPASSYCTPSIAPTLSLAPSGTVNQQVPVSLRYGFADVPPGVGFGTVFTFDGAPLPVEHIGYQGQSVDNLRFRVPATTAGVHLLRATRSDGAVVSTNFTVVPRIKIAPSPAARDSTVDVSLRGYGRGESVRLRWKRGAAFVTLATVTTSNTGSANVALRVPTFAPNGLQVVRGDGTSNRAQTNAFEVQGGPFVAARPNRSPTPTPTISPTAVSSATVTSEPTSTATTESTSVATDVPTPTATALATEERTEIAPLEPTIERAPSPDVSPTVETPIESEAAASPAA